MISEEALRQAAAEANDCLVRSFDELDIPVHNFSARFERKMRRLIRRTRHPAAYRALVRVACAFLAFLLGSGVFLAVNPEARAAFFGWVRTQYSEFFVYFFPESAEDSMNAEYTLGWLPEGYHESVRHTSDGMTRITYTNDIGDRINLFYSKTYGLYVSPKNNNVYSVTVNGEPADIYYSEKNVGRHDIVWGAKDNSIIFTITANVQDEELIRMAENIQVLIHTS